MKIERFEIVESCLFWCEEKILIVGDMHLGYENYLEEGGWSFPKTQMEVSEVVLKKIFKKTGKLKKVILLGDVKHFFSGILAGEYSDFNFIMGLIKKNLVEKGKVIITKGNHDKILAPIIKRYNFVSLKDVFVWKDVGFFHGHFDIVEDLNKGLLDKKIKIILIGHYHPAVTLKDDVKQERYKCFLYGKHKKLKKKLIILPSFFPLVEGSDIFSNSIIKDNNINISRFEVYAVDGDGKVYDFGKAGKLELVHQKG